MELTEKMLTTNCDKNFISCIFLSMGVTSVIKECIVCMLPEQCRG